jgi:hypothetical protein
MQLNYTDSVGPNSAQIFAIFSYLPTLYFSYLHGSPWKSEDFERKYYIQNLEHIIIIYEDISPPYPTPYNWYIILNYVDHFKSDLQLFASKKGPYLEDVIRSCVRL